jgi:23S rRNA pseudouridine1911/1915/1917 synthase
MRVNPRVHEVLETEAGSRLDRVLAAVWPDYSRSYWQQQIEAGRVTVDGRHLRAGAPVKAGQVVSCELAPEAPPLAWDTAQALPSWPPWVLYHDAVVIVVNKPRGLVVHPSAGHRDDSVVHQLLPWLPVTDGTPRPGVVHRLDKDTSGLLLMARTAQARDALSLAISQREVRRDYLAVVRGHLAPRSGVVDAPLGRDPRQRLKMAVVLGGRPARTHYRTIAAWSGFSAVQCTLETGRTHQIRVHLASLGHPVIGDPLYGGRHPLFTQGQLLHAGRLGFVHPAQQYWMELEAEVPDDWRALAQAGPAEVVDAALYASSPAGSTRQWLTQLGCAVVSRNS